MYNMQVFSLLLLVATLHNIRCAENGQNHWISSHLATKTPYDSKRDDPFHESHEWIPANIPQGYKIEHIDVLYRHGTRYPSRQKLSIWWTELNSLNKIVGHEKLSEALKIWNDLYPKHRNYTLHAKGWSELGNLAENMFKMAPRLFKDILNDQKKNSFLLLTSPKIRVLASARSYLSTLLCLVGQGKCDAYREWKVLEADLTSQNGLTYYSGILVQLNSSLLRPFDFCPRYQQLMHENEAGTSEYQLFFRTDVWREAKQEISRFFHGFEVTDEAMVALYQLCAFDKALHDRNQLCSGFSRFFFEVLEYVSDLKHFYKTGYGFRINYLLACPLLEDIVRGLDASVDPNSKNGSVVLRFGHAETLIPLLCLLGLYQDDVRLTAHNFPLHRHSRKFRTGTFSPFAGNVAIVLYKFGPNFKIAVVVNERVVKLPFAQCHYCDYSTFKHMLSKRLEGIKCNTVCDLNRHTEL